MKRIHQTLQIAYGITLLLCGQKGRKTVKTLDLTVEYVQLEAYI